MPYPIGHHTGVKRMIIIELGLIVLTEDKIRLQCGDR